jgi:carboxylate-amine ligase
VTSAESRPPADTGASAEGYEHRFGASPPLSIGVEEELLLVDERRCLTPVSEDVLAAVDREARDGVTAEIFAAQIELKTHICHDAAEAERELTELRRAVRKTGVELIASGLHPADESEEAQLVPKPRYMEVHKDLQGLLKTPPCGLHVHVGMPDPETAVRVANALRHRLSLLQALTANSPFWHGVDSGLASARTAVVHSYPRFEMPRAFRDYEDFCRVADQLIAAAGVEDYTFIWWDVRPHPRLGTVEVRGMDVPTSPATSAAVAALIQALAAKEIDRPDTPELTREALEESYYQASRYGLGARLLVDEETAAEAAEVAADTLEEIRPYARELGSDAALAEIERILRDGNGADDQRRIHEASGMDGLLDCLLERTRGERQA